MKIARALVDAVLACSGQLRGGLLGSSGVNPHTMTRVEGWRRKVDTWPRSASDTLALRTTWITTPSALRVARYSTWASAWA